MPEVAQTAGAACTAGLGIVNGGLQVVNPCADVYDLITQVLESPSSVESYEFADQSLLSDLFKQRWVPIPYIYNALKTLRWRGVHDAIWRDDKVKNVHYILSPKPWDEAEGVEGDETHAWWKKMNRERIAGEKERGIDDGF